MTGVRPDSRNDGLAEVTSPLRNESMVDLRELVNHPKIILSRELKGGQNHVAATHAALAWHLKYCDPRETQAEAQTGLFKPEDITRVDPEHFEDLKKGGTYITMTESRLQNRETAIVGLDIPEIEPVELPEPPEFEPLHPVTALNLKMYIVVRRSPLPYSQAITAAVNSTIAAYTKFHDDEMMQRWVADKFYKTICSASSAEFDRACEDENVAIVNRTDTGEPAAVAYCPRLKWPGRMKFLQLYK